jgi:hypothetical protein
MRMREFLRTFFCFDYSAHSPSRLFSDRLHQVLRLLVLPTRQKTPSPLLNRTEQCFAAHVVHTCQQY